MISNIEQPAKIITNRANQLVKQLIELRHNEKPPFLPHEYFPLLGIKGLQKSDLGTVSGLLLRLNGGSTIVVNQEDSLLRQNFSCAHELSHILFDELKLQEYIPKIEFRNTFSSQPESLANARMKERLCDIAAAELLMPTEIFGQYLLRMGVSIDSVAPLAGVFQVSNSAAAIRVAEVSPEPCIAFIWKLWVKRKTRVLSLSRSRNKSFCEPVNAEAEVGSSLFNAFEHNVTTKCYKNFKFNDKSIKRCYTESKGFGYGKTRHVVSLVFPGR